MIEIVCSKIINKNTFLIHFIDKQKDEINLDQSEKIHNYETVDGSEIKMGLRVNVMSKSVLIDVKIKYPPNSYNPNYHELIKSNQKRFQDFYNEIMNYNQTRDYHEVMDFKESHVVRNVDPHEF